MERYRSGHNEAVLKPPCHSGSNPRKSPVFAGDTRTFRTAKFFLLMFFLIQFHSSVYTEGYRSGHNEAVLKTVWGQPHKGSNPFLSAIKSLENTTFSRLFSFLPGSAFDRFLLNFSLVSRNFSSNRKSQKPLIHKGFRDFCSGRFLEIFFVCVVRAIFSMKTQIVFIFIATDLAFCPAQYNPICIEHRC